jgi:hypothetical protein
MCRTPDEAFASGWNAPCEHDTEDPTVCPACRLTGAEIARLAVLHRPYVRPVVVGEETPAA